MSEEKIIKEGMMTIVLHSVEILKMGIFKFYLFEACGLAVGQLGLCGLCMVRQFVSHLCVTLGSRI